MAKELTHFKNFAKLKNTKVAFNDITVLAGKPGTGKSYVMKFQYAYDETVSSIANGSYKSLYAQMGSSEQEKAQLDLNKSFIKLNFTLLDVTQDEEDFLSNVKQLVEESNSLEALELLKKNRSNIKDEKIFNSLSSYLKKDAKWQKEYFTKTDEEKFHLIFRNILESIFTSIDQINNKFIYENSNSKLEYKESKLSILKYNVDRNLKNSIFVETPLILEFEKFLPTERYKTPYHIDSLLRELNKKDFGFTSDETSDFINAFKQSSQKIVNGNISKNSGGFSFESDNGKTYDIINASSGVKSIGLLQYLVTNKALKKGTALYWEEPEVHLHPEWQLRIVELFVELMNAGVKIVFSTHSPFMADYLNAMSKRNNFENRVSFNLFKETDGKVKNHIVDNDDKWNMIQDELLGSLKEIMWQYV